MMIYYIKYKYIIYVYIITPEKKVKFSETNFVLDIIIFNN